MPARPLPPIVGATENALRPLLTQIVARSPIGGYDEWVYLNVRDTADDPAQVENLVADALKRSRDDVGAARTRLSEAGLLDTQGALTPAAREQLTRCRELVAQTTQTLTSGIDPAAVQTTIETLEIVRTRAEELLAG